MLSRSMTSRRWWIHPMLTRANSARNDLSCKGSSPFPGARMPGSCTARPPEVDMRSTAATASCSLTTSRQRGARLRAAVNPRLQRPTTAGRPTIPSASGTRPGLRHVMAGEARRREALGERQRQRLVDGDRSADSGASATRPPARASPRLRRAAAIVPHAGSRTCGMLPHEAENVADEAAGIGCATSATDGVPCTTSMPSCRDRARRQPARALDGASGASERRTSCWRRLASRSTTSIRTGAPPSRRAVSVAPCPGMECRASSAPFDHRFGVAPRGMSQTVGHPGRWLRTSRGPDRASVDRRVSMTLTTAAGRRVARTEEGGPPGGADEEPK